MIEQIKLDFFDISYINCALENFKNKMLIENNQRILYQVNLLKIRFNNYELSYNQDYTKPIICVLSNINEYVINLALNNELERLKRDFEEIIKNVGLEMFIDYYNKIIQIKNSLNIAKL